MWSLDPLGILTRWHLKAVWDNRGGWSTIAQFWSVYNNDSHQSAALYRVSPTHLSAALCQASPGCLHGDAKQQALQ